jgi:hypothetical protein
VQLPNQERAACEEAEGRFNAGWARWNETSFPLAWASEKIEYTPDLAEIGDKKFDSTTNARSASGPQSLSLFRVDPDGDRPVVH